MSAVRMNAEYQMWSVMSAASIGSSEIKATKSMIRLRAMIPKSLSLMTEDARLRYDSGIDVTVLMTFLKSPEAANLIVSKQATAATPHLTYLRKEDEGLARTHRPR